MKGKYIGELSKQAATAYARILTRYPLMDRSEDARKRLAALHQPIPRPTKAAVAQNKAEIASRSEASTVQMLMGLIKKSPDVARAAHGAGAEPTLVDPEPLAATTVVRNETFAAAGVPEPGSKSATIEVVQPGGGDATPPAATPPGASPFGAAATGTTTPPIGPDPNELKPTAPPDPNELKPTDTGNDPALPPPTQVNEIQQGQSSSAATAKADDSTPASDEELSSSKKHKKKGLKKINPF
jgi:hypothetical protein